MRAFPSRQKFFQKSKKASNRKRWIRIKTRCYYINYMSAPRFYWLPLSKLFALQFVEANVKTHKQPKLTQLLASQFLATCSQQINIEVKFSHMVWYWRAPVFWSMGKDNWEVKGAGSLLGWPYVVKWPPSLAHRRVLGIPASLLLEGNFPILDGQRPFSLFSRR